MKKNLFANVVGWYGVVAILAAYGLLTLGILKSGDLSYHLLNLTGSAGLIISSATKRDWQSDALNIIYAIIAAIGIIGVFAR